MKYTKNKYAEKWYSRYHTIANGCSIMCICTIIILIYFLLIEKLFDKVLICFLIGLFLFFCIITIFVFRKCKKIKKDIK